MRYAVIIDGVVKNIAESDPKTAEEAGWVAAPPGVEIGDTHDGKAFAKAPVPPAVPAERAESAEAAIQRLLDETAQKHGYDDMRSLISYRGCANAKWSAEADAGFAWRTAVWEAAEAVQNEYLAGKRALPTVDEVVQALPAIAWPA